ncbi:MAG TPA: diaminopimelate decarboxylase [Phycisphaerae bacterium]|jgi:diaminopimelate decarboxylase
MDHFRYRDGLLFCEDVPIPRLADEFGTPLFVYSRQTLVDHFNRFATAFAELKPIICYSIKSCQNLTICRLLRERGAAFDVVSGGELSRALEAGADPRTIVFAGVGKTDDEIRQAIAAGIGWFNVESEPELENLQRLADESLQSVNAALRINPDVDPKTHVYTSTGKRETKFGVDIERAMNVFQRYGRHPRVRLSALHVHIGSPVNQIEPYIQAAEKALALIARLRADGFSIDTLDIGGGFGAHYQGSEAPPAAEYAAAIVPLLRGKGLRIILEPGRSISANAGILIGRTLYVKDSGDKHFVITDASMTELIRPALYGAYHFIWPVAPTPPFIPPQRSAARDLPGTLKVDVVGPVCESGDFLAKDRLLPPMQRGDLLAFFTAGAYGFVMSSQYNSRPRAAEVLVEGDRARLIRRRETYDDLVAPERF